MQLQNLILLALSAGALALPAPAPDTANSTLIERGSAFGAIGSYDNGQCTGKPLGARPNLDGHNCVKFKATTNNVGINWGDWPFRMDSMDVFKNDHCGYDQSGKPAATITAPQYNNKQGTNSCIDMAAHGGPWGSVQQSIN